MKRNYVTPVIVMENFNVTQSIAGCITKINSLDAGCVLKDSDSTRGMKDLAEYFGYFIEGCDESAYGMTDEDGTCYHTSANAAFTS